MSVKYGAVPSVEAEIAKKGSVSAPAPVQGIGLVYMAIGSFSFATMFLLVKLVGGVFSTFSMVMYRSIVQLVISLGVLAVRRENPLGPPDGRIRFLLLLRGAFGSFAVAAFFFATQYLPLPDAITLQFTTPVFAAIIAVCLVGEPWRPLDMIGAAVCMLGVLMIAQPPWLFGAAEESEGIEPAIEPTSAADSSIDDDGDMAADQALAAAAVVIGLSGAAMAGTAYVLVRKIGEGASSVVMVVYYAAASIVMCPVGSWLMGTGWNVLAVSGTVPELFCLLCMGFCGYGGQLFTNLGLQHESAATATLVANTQIVYSYIFEATILHEGMKPWSVAGTCLIIAYMILVGVITYRESSKKALAESEHAHA